MINECEPRAGVRERTQLINVAYRLLGSVVEAEDAVQETYARWHAMTREQQQAIETPAAWLTKVASRICLDMLGSARVRRERYVGEWLPEPLPEPAEWVGERRDTSTVDPADRITLDESINMALLVVLDAMTPAERVAFILHDVFRYSFSEVAEIVGRTPAACRQLASTARRRTREARAPAAATARQARIVRDFKRAWEVEGHQRPDRTPRPRRHGGRRRRRPRQRLPAPDPRWRTGRARLPRLRQRGTGSDDLGTHRQRPAWPGGPAGRRHDHRLGVRDRRRADQAHLGDAQPRQAPPVDDGLTGPHTSGDHVVEPV